MVEHSFNTQQQSVLNLDLKTHIFLEGPFKSGKTALALARLREYAINSDPTHQVLVLIPQQTLSLPYRHCIQNPDFPAGVLPTIITLAGLARKFITLN